jgi:hypothetical protein
MTEALGMAIYMGAGPSVMYASYALEAFSQLPTAPTVPLSCALKIAQRAPPVDHEPIQARARL